MEEKFLPDKVRRLLIGGIYLIVILCGISYYLVLTTGRVEVPCPYFEETGKWCGGCGSTRMAMSLIELDFKSAFNYNPVAFCTIFFWNAVGIGAFIGKPKILINWKFLVVSATVTLAAFVMFTLMRF